MWALLKGFLGRSKILNASLGDVVFKTPGVRGQGSHSFLQWRVKRGLRGNGYFIGVQMLPDAYIGRDGSYTTFINFNIRRAQLVKYHLDLCIAEYYRVTNHIPPETTSSAGQSSGVLNRRSQARVLPDCHSLDARGLPCGHS